LNELSRVSVEWAELEWLDSCFRNLEYGPITYAPSFTKKLQNHEALVGSRAKFVCKAIGEPRPTIQWSVNNNDSSNCDYSNNNNSNEIIMIVVTHMSAVAVIIVMVRITMELHLF